MKRSIIISVVLSVFLFSECTDIEIFPDDGLSLEEVEGDPEGAQLILNGVYSFLKEHPFPRAYHLGFEWPSDNLMMMKTSGSSSFFYYNYKHSVDGSYVESFYQESYKAIALANDIYVSFSSSGTAEEKQMKGEALFIRTLLHFALVQTHGRPYTQDPETNLGIIYMHEPSLEFNLSRSTVKECYDWIVRDFREAAALMNIERNNNYASKEAAWALLARVYLYMEENQLAHDYADSVIQSGKYALVDGDDLVNTPRIAPEENTETIFAFKTTANEEPNRSWVGAKYYLSRDGVGRGTISVSQPLRDLLFEHEFEDKRVYAYTDPRFVQKVLPPYGDTLDAEGNRIWEIDNGYPVHYMTKFSNQYGLVLSCSVVISRLAEMYFIRAEANAKMGAYALAIDDVNIIRARAGLTDYLYDYTSTLEETMDVILNEKRIEFMFEGHRAIDLWRNGRTIDRSYPGSHLDGGDGFTEIPPDHPYVIQFIPEAEILLNPNLEQNPGL